MTPALRSNERNHALRCNNLGLTLVEMIAALIILSSATTAGIGIVQNSSISAQGAALRLDAVDVYERWRQHVTLNPTATLPWRWVDGNDNIWIVSDSGSRPAGALATAGPTTTPPQAQIALQASLRWRSISVTLEHDAAPYPAVIFERLESAPEPAPDILIGSIAP